MRLEIYEEIETRRQSLMITARSQAEIVALEKIYRRLKSKRVTFSRTEGTILIPVHGRTDE